MPCCTVPLVLLTLHIPLPGSKVDDVLKVREISLQAALCLFPLVRGLQREVLAGLVPLQAVGQHPVQAGVAQELYGGSVELSQKLHGEGVQGWQGEGVCDGKHEQSYSVTRSHHADPALLASVREDCMCMQVEDNPSKPPASHLASPLPLPILPITALPRTLALALLLGAVTDSLAPAFPVGPFSFPFCCCSLGEVSELARDLHVAHGRGFSRQGWLRACWGVPP